MAQLAPYASTGGHSAYVFPGSTIQTTNFVKGLFGNHRWWTRALGWLLLIALVAVTVGISVWQLFIAP